MALSCKKTAYTPEEDAKIFDYIVKHNAFTQTKGKKLWEDMEASKEIPNRSAYSLKERFRMRLCRDIDKYSMLTDEQKQQILDHRKTPKSNKRAKRKLPNEYSFDDDEVIVNYICKAKAFDKIHGTLIFKRMEREKILPRSWQSMKERFRKKILPNIEKYNITVNDQEKFSQVSKKSDLSKCDECGNAKTVSNSLQNSDSLQEPPSKKRKKFTSRSESLIETSESSKGTPHAVRNDLQPEQTNADPMNNCHIHKLLQHAFTSSSSLCKKDEQSKRQNRRHFFVNKLCDDNVCTTTNSDQDVCVGQKLRRSCRIKYKSKVSISHNSPTPSDNRNITAGVNHKILSNNERLETMPHELSCRDSSLSSALSENHNDNQNEMQLLSEYSNHVSPLMSQEKENAAETPTAIPENIRDDVSEVFMNICESEANSGEGMDTRVSKGEHSLSESALSKNSSQCDFLSESENATVYNEINMIEAEQVFQEKHTFIAHSSISQPSQLPKCLKINSVVEDCEVEGISTSCSENEQVCPEACTHSDVSPSSQLSEWLQIGSVVEDCSENEQSALGENHNDNLSDCINHVASVVTQQKGGAFKIWTESHQNIEDDVSDIIMHICESVANLVEGIDIRVSKHDSSPSKIELNKNSSRCHWLLEGENPSEVECITISSENEQSIKVGRKGLSSKSMSTGELNSLEHHQIDSSTEIVCGECRDSSTLHQMSQCKPFVSVNELLNSSFDHSHEDCSVISESTFSSNKPHQDDMLNYDDVEDLVKYIHYNNVLVARIIRPT